jgi:chemotaxis protein methyltransferase CheR
MSKAILEYFSNLIAKEIGITYVESDYYQLEIRLQNFQKLKSYESMEAIYTKFQSGRATSQEFQEFLELATNNETSFFRDTTLFRALKSEIFPKALDALPSGQTFRIWSAAASSGQEACSIAMTLDELQHHRSFQFHIQCTDFNAQVLARAKEGIFTHLETSRGLSPELMEKYFTLVDDGKPVSPQPRHRFDSRLLQKMSFSQLNLLTPFPSSEMFHVVFLRNMLIYQSVPNRKQIVLRLKDKIVPGGFLVLGATENLIGIDETSFEQASIGGAVLYRRNP